LTYKREHGHKPNLAEKDVRAAAAALEMNEKRDAKEASQQWNAGQTSRLLPLSLNVTSSSSETPTFRPSADKRVSISGMEVAPSRASDTTCSD
jgi:hypothetical protein